MKTIKASSIVSCLLIFVFAISACSVLAPAEAPTNTPAPTATVILTSTNTPRPSATPRPTRTPNFAATERYEAFKAETQKYYDLGYLSSTNGKFKEIDDFEEEWAQLNWFRWWPINQKASDFYMSAHFAWESAYRNADTSGCGFIFALTPDKLYYAVFLDRSRVHFLTKTKSGVRRQGVTRGSNAVKFDYPAEADFTLIVKGLTAYVLVNDELTGEYTLSQSKAITGDIALTVLSGTNKDYGTRCEMTDVRLFIPD
ncbi:MAG: hypothetical protein IPP66_22725 [Anaerolineales bacterium]|nr:hypothetical protein [Anaerolineales bacterium]